MLFSSVTFLFYFLPAFLILYYLTPSKYKNYTLLLGSIAFYSWGGPVFIFVIFGTTAFDYFMVKQIERTSDKKIKKIFLVFSLIMNLWLLFGFKYLNFFADVLNELIGFGEGEGIQIAKIILPIGISFFTFESLTYVIDVYRGEQKSLNSFQNYLTYILMFPKLIAGPIVPYNKIGTQIESERVILPQNRLSGFIRFIFGLSKKVLIANILGKTVSEIYELDSSTIDSCIAWVASLAYTMQLYFDFSGYSDMAIGLGEMIGFKIPENFNFPYISKSITEFWKRWHISLGNWMRNYLYIPLGGNRVGKYATYFNLWLVFLLSGFWHGAGWNFLFWGAYHGFFLVIERLFLNKYLKGIHGVFYTLFVANIGWLFFRNEDFSISIMMLKKMFSFEFNSIEFFDVRFIFILLVAILFSFSGLIKSFYNSIQKEEYFVNGNVRLSLFYIAAIVCFILSASFLIAEDFNPFIYFRF